MVEKDIMEKILLSYADVFADCENVLMYDGEQRLKAEEMQPASTESFYFKGGGSGGKEGRRKFTSDMGFVTDYLNEGNFESRKEQKIIHMEALCRMMEVLTGDSRFTDSVGEMLQMQEGGRKIVMCEYINMLEARGEARGKEMGEDMLTSLLTQLYTLGREEDVKLVLKDKEARKRMYQEFSIADH